MPWEQWTDDMLVEIGKVYAYCDAGPMNDVRPNWPARGDTYQLRPDSPVRSIYQVRAIEITRELRDKFVEPARKRLRDEKIAAAARQELADYAARSRLERAERLKSEQERNAAEQAKQDAERTDRLKKESALAEANRAARLAQAKKHALREQEAADEMVRQAEAEEKALAEMTELSEETRAKREAAEKRLAQVRAATEAQRRRDDVQKFAALPPSDDRKSFPSEDQPLPPPMSKELAKALSGEIDNFASDYNRAADTMKLDTAATMTKCDVGEIKVCQFLATGETGGVVSSKDKSNIDSVMLFCGKGCIPISFMSMLAVSMKMFAPQVPLKERGNALQSLLGRLENSDETEVTLNGVRWSLSKNPMIGNMVIVSRE